MRPAQIGSARSRASNQFNAVGQGQGSSMLLPEHLFMPPGRIRAGILVKVLEKLCTSGASDMAGASCKPSPVVRKLPERSLRMILLKHVRQISVFGCDACDTREVTLFLGG